MNQSLVYVLYSAIHGFGLCVFGIFFVDRYNRNYGKEVSAIYGTYISSCFSLLIAITRFKLSKIPLIAENIGYILDFYQVGFFLGIGTLWYFASRRKRLNLIKPGVVLLGAYLLPMCLSTFANYAYWASFFLNMDFDLSSYDNLIIIFIDGLIVAYVVLLKHHIWEILNKNLKGLKYLLLYCPIVLFIYVVEVGNLATYTAPAQNNTSLE